MLYYYNSDNTLQYKHDAKGQETVYSYDTAKHVTEIQVFPTGQTHSEDTCQQVLYSYDTNPYSPTYSQYSTGRLAAAQYTHCDSFSIADPGDSDLTDSFGSTTFTENYSYHPAGAPTGKWLLMSRFAQLACCGQMATSASFFAAYTYNSAGQLSSTTVPSETFYHGYDSMGRPGGLTDLENVTGGYWGSVSMSTTWVKNVQYDVAGRMTSLQYQTGYGDDTETGDPWAAYTTESMTYNVNGQLTSRGWATPALTGYASAGLSGGVTYSYSGTQNNGQITQASDTVSGETITYAYDSLKRLTSATSAPISGSTPAAWTQGYQYDGFGNLTSKVLNNGANTIPWAVDGTTNRFGSGSSYDANGNLLSGPGVTLTYDSANRVASAVPTGGGTEYYGYAPDNKRIYRRNTATGAEEWTFFGARGEKIGTFRGITLGNGLTLTQTKRYVWFGGKLIWEGPPVPAGGSSYYIGPYEINGAIIYQSMASITGGNAFQDRLGSNRASGSRYYPYGEEIGTATGNDREKFATYNRDSFTTLDYADQRYYANTNGRFNTADPYQASAGPDDPASWNRYVYVKGDPVNHSDRRGLMMDEECAGFGDDLAGGGDCWGGGGYDPCDTDYWSAACGDPSASASPGPVSLPNNPVSGGGVGGNNFVPVLAPVMGPPLVICALDPLCAGAVVVGGIILVGIPRLNQNIISIVNPILQAGVAVVGGIIGIIGTPKPGCSPPVGTIGYRYDSVPPSRRHWPFPGDHVHLYQMNQSPEGRCFWSPIGVTDPPPSPGAIPL